MSTELRQMSTVAVSLTDDALAIRLAMLLMKPRRFTAQQRAEFVLEAAIRLWGESHGEALSDYMRSHHASYFD